MQNMSPLPTYYSQFPRSLLTPKSSITLRDHCHQILFPYKRQIVKPVLYVNIYLYFLSSFYHLFIILFKVQQALWFPDSSMDCIARIAIIAGSVLHLDGRWINFVLDSVISSQPTTELCAFHTGNLIWSELWLSSNALSFNTRKLVKSTTHGNLDSKITGFSSEGKNRI